MFLLARNFWGDKGALISALFYIYAPYRAVDVWVRGALPEALAFIFFPLILLSVEKKKYLSFSVLIFLLLITHNLSIFMFLPFLGIWWLVRSRDWKFLPAGLLSLVLGSFYLLPVIFESKLVTLTQTTADYYNYSLHWTTLSQLFLSRFWGYGGSTWGPNDTMSFSAGHLHWILALVIAITIAGKYLTLNPSPKLGEGTKGRGIIVLGLALSLLALFLTHGKSEIFWKLVPGLPFVQFPWRFLSMSTLFLSLANGAIVSLFHKSAVPAKALATAGYVLLLLLNIGFFKPDIWKSVTDTQYFSGASWDEMRSSALSDYWPKTAGPLPAQFALPDTIVYFPGWTSIVDGVEQSVVPDSRGFVTSTNLVFKDTFVRTLGNIISGLTAVGIISWIFFKPKHAS